MRMSDFKRMLGHEQDELQTEGGPYRKRPTWLKYAEWVALAGGRVRGVGEEQQLLMLEGHKLNTGSRDDDGAEESVSD